jgi:hypothetical protein
MEVGSNSKLFLHRPVSTNTGVSESDIYSRAKPQLDTPIAEIILQGQDVVLNKIEIMLGEHDVTANHRSNECLSTIHSEKVHISINIDTVVVPDLRAVM